MVVQAFGAEHGVVALLDETREAAGTI